jgi:RNA polymerase sigma factor (TIGR02999 family)
MEVERADGVSESITQLLVDWRDGKAGAFNQLLPLVYEELCRLARRQRRRSGSSETLNTTALAHEAYLKLVDHRRVGINDRGHFFAVAAKAMRQILIDYARRRSALKRGGNNLFQAGTEAEAVVGDGSNIIAIDLALAKLESLDERLAHLVELRVFAGLSVDETADALGLSSRTVKREWQKARAFLSRELSPSGPVA